MICNINDFMTPILVVIFFSLICVFSTQAVPNSASRGMEEKGIHLCQQAYHWWVASKNSKDPLDALRNAELAVAYYQSTKYLIDDKVIERRMGMDSQQLWEKIMSQEKKCMEAFQSSSKRGKQSSSSQVVRSKKTWM